MLHGRAKLLDGTIPIFTVKYVLFTGRHGSCFSGGTVMLGQELFIQQGRTLTTAGHVFLTGRDKQLRWFRRGNKE